MLQHALITYSVLNARIASISHGMYKNTSSCSSSSGVFKNSFAYLRGAFRRRFCMLRDGTTKKNRGALSASNLRIKKGRKGRGMERELNRHRTKQMKRGTYIFRGGIRKRTPIRIFSSCVFCFLIGCDGGRGPNEASQAAQVKGVMGEQREESLVLALTVPRCWLASFNYMRRG